MRALGPGSVSSFLKIVLDVVFVVLWVAVIAVAVLASAALMFSFNPNILPPVGLGAAAEEVVQNGPIFAAGLAAAGLYLAGVLAIVGTLRRIFATLTAGDPFHPDNVPRLRLVGLLLAGLEIGRYLFFGASAWLLHGVRRLEASFSVTTWFSVLVVFVLAEVFREGARLRGEARLTI